MSKKKDKNINDNLKKIENMSSVDNDIKGKLFVVVGVLFVFIIFYLATVFVTNKNSDNDKQDDLTETSFVYDEIILGRSLSMGKNDYYVIYYDFSDSSINSIYSELINNYNSKDEHLKLYKVDMSNGFNSKYKTDGDSNKYFESTADMLVNGPTLIKVSNKKLVEYIEGEEQIRNYLG